METVVVAAQKGGSGKTTIAIHLAVAATATRSTILVDADPQQSLFKWGQMRSQRKLRDGYDQRSPEVFQSTATRLPALLDAAASDGMQLAFVDTPPHSTAEAARLLRTASLIVIPVRPTMLDLAALEATMKLVRASGRPATVVLSACPARAPEIDEAVMIVNEMGLPLAPTRITDRRAYSRSLSSGRAVFEIPRAEFARAEVAALWQWLHATITSCHHATTVAS